MSHIRDYIELNVSIVFGTILNLYGNGHNKIPRYMEKMPRQPQYTQSKYLTYPGFIITNIKHNFWNYTQFVWQPNIGTAKISNTWKR